MNQKQSQDQSSSMTTAEKSLHYHQFPQPGKIQIISSKECQTQDDLTLAYTPGVATPCVEIKKDPSKVWQYTSRGNLVAVVSDGTAVLGLGNIGPEAGLPVMEGKAVLFKRFADIDTVPLCLGKVHHEDGTTNAEKLIEMVECLEPTFGGINLEDIAAPACFKVEQTLKQKMSIPVFHDDQHGTAIISLAGILNALKLVNKSIESAKFVVNGAGAAGLSCARFYIRGGAKIENITMVDKDGVIHTERNDLPIELQPFAKKTSGRTLADVIHGADVFLGVSVGNCLTPEMIQSMAPNPIVFAMANPTPEIMPDLALKAGAAIVGTGRSDFPNQINNALGFPGIFRGALDTRATEINEEMKLAASLTLAQMMNKPIPEEIKQSLKKAYPKDYENGMFEGEVPLKPTLVIPKLFDGRIVPMMARAVAEAAMKTGVAQIQIEDLNQYEQELYHRLNRI